VSPEAKELAALREVADVAREALKHMERHGVTIAGKKLRDALERLDGKEANDGR
jgi:ribulose-5-phosphate 4-epimerase/fuculose-1-phosphate aldolase